MKSPALDIDENKNKAARSDRIRLFFRKNATIIGLLGLIIVFEALRPSLFFTVVNIKNILVAVAITGVVACGETVVFALNDFDMSVGSTASMVGIIGGSLMVDHHLPWALAVIIGMLIGAVAGAFNGVMVAYVNLNPFITTMGTLTAFQGIAYVYKNGATVYGVPHGYLYLGQSSIGPIPVLVIVLAVVALIAFFVMERTTLGRRWYAVGGNYDASYLAGIRVRRIRALAFVVSGTAGALAGMLLGSRLGGMTPLMGSNLTLNSIAGVFLGMTAFREGLPNVGGTIVGVVFLGVLVNGLAMLHVNSYIQLVITGFFIIGAVALAGAMKKNRA